MYKSIKELDIYISDGNYSSKYPRSEEFVDEGIPFIRGNNMIDGEIVDEDMYHITEEKHSILLKGHVQTGDVLITTRGNIGQVAIIPERHDDSNINAQIVLLRVNKDELYNRYLLWALQSHKSKEQYLALQTGTALKQLPVGKLEQVKIKYVDLQSQLQVAEILDKVYQIIKIRKRELFALDNLIKARFVELFGNLVIGDKVDTNKKKIGEIASVTKLAGFEFTKYIQYKEQGDIIMLRGLNCKKGRLVLDDIKWIDKETSDLLPRSKLYYGDILMTYAGTIGDVAMVDEDDKYHLAPNVAKITLNDKKACNPIFLMHLFMYTNDYIMTFASVVAQASINMEKIRNFEYYFPPVELQNQFAAFVEQTDKSKFVSYI